MTEKKADWDAINKEIGSVIKQFQDTNTPSMAIAIALAEKLKPYINDSMDEDVDLIMRSLGFEEEE